MELSAHVKYLADRRLKGRSSGTRGCDLAAVYLRKQFRHDGIPGALKQGKRP